MKSISVADVDVKYRAVEVPDTALVASPHRLCRFDLATVKADELSVAGLARKVNDLADRARAKKLNPDEVHGGTFTITNFGMFGGLFGLPIIPQPQVGILGTGGVEKRPVVVNDAIAIRSMESAPTSR